MGHGNPAASSDVWQPDIVRAIRREMVGVSLYGKAGEAKDGRKLQAKVSIGEKDDTQATRSYRTASCISATLRS